VYKEKKLVFHKTCLELKLRDARASMHGVARRVVEVEVEERTREQLLFLTYLVEWEEIPL
jgi:hypothetical protein